MLNAFQAAIMEATGVGMPDELAQIEEIMRGENNRPLDELSQSEFADLARDAKEANDIVKEMGA
ncbi:hypothetical protein JYP52_21530 [Nitratireductor aquibiodomus]|uniref:hypothetical protein n=1 Tax=Nitratireductor TaxID=245876 RepID=UPI0013AF83A7|nr:MULTISPECIES: hypothetical protein [Nitratireductor]MBN7763724.1 hypothetical protein [Nitratireductor aquibiodomus]